MKTRSAKNKGMRLQKFIAGRIAEIFNVEFDNQNDQSLVQSRTAGLSGTDIILRGHIYENFKFDCECKNTEKVSLYHYIEQAKSNMEEGRDWLVIHKKNRSEPIAILSWEALEKIIKENLTLKGII